MTRQQLAKLFLLKAKYATASAFASGVDWLFYLALVYWWMGEEKKALANFITYPIGVLVNFFLQKRFIFNMQRKLSVTFGLAMAVSAGGWALNSGLFFALMSVAFFNMNHLLTKLLVNGLVFFYNFYLKRYVFEKKLFSMD